MVPKLVRVVTYHKGLSLINSNERLVTCCYKIKSETRIVISLLPQYLWPTNMAWCWLTLRASYPWSHITFQSRGVARSRDQLQTLDLHYQLPQCYNYHIHFQIQKSNICNFVNDNMLNYFDQDLETVIENLTQNMKIALTCSKSIPRSFELWLKVKIDILNMC